MRIYKESGARMQATKYITVEKKCLKPYKNRFWRWRITWQSKSTRIPLGKMRNDGQIFYLPSAVIIVEKNPKWQDPIFNLMLDGEENVA